MDFPRLTQTDRNITHELYSAVMSKNWERVEEIYKEHQEIHASKITSFRDTALHLAIDLGAPKSTVLNMLDAIRNTQNVMECLSATNQKGETPLHRAATHGYPAICRRIIDLEHEHDIAQQSLDAGCNNNGETPLLGLDGQDTIETNHRWLVAKRNNNGETPLSGPDSQDTRETNQTSLVAKRNNNGERPPSSPDSQDNRETNQRWLVAKRNNIGETPLFNAAHNGRKRTFLYLSSVSTRMGMASDPDLWRRDDGDTMLHCTIRREYFELSYLIIHLYDIATLVDKDKNKPLDILTSIPSGFRSATATHLTWWQKLHYHYIRVEPLMSLPSPTDSSIDITPEGNVNDESPENRGSLRKLKEKHKWCNRILDKLVTENSGYEYNDNKGARFIDLSEEMKLQSSSDQKATNTSGKRRVALLMATKYGLTEAVEKILKEAPVAIFENTEDRKNIVLVAVKERQTHILNLLMKDPLWPSLRKAKDAEGNNALHLAAKLSKQIPWEIPGSFMQMQWEVKWFEYVKENMPTYLEYEANEKGQTPEEIFVEEHKELVKTSNEWLKDTAASYSLIASITATVAFAASTQVPGGNNDNTGKPILQGQPIFNTFNISTLVAFSFSITSLASFLAVFCSRKQPQDFKMGLPMKLLFGLSSFFVSIVCILISFCAAHFFEFESGTKNKLTPLYTLILLPLIIYAIAQLRLYVLLLKSSVSKLPLPKYVGQAVLM